MYLEPWHADVFQFLDLKKNHGNELERARDLFYALWIPDLFMKRVKEDGTWSLMCPHECPGLSDCHSSAFVTLYESYERQKKYRKQIKAREIWQAILTSQIETGTPYLLYKDACNRKSNQQNLGTIKSSNLCTEIIEYTSPDETAVCNLASIALKKFVMKPNLSEVELLIYSKPQCVNCDLAKAFCKKRCIAYEEKSYKDLTAVSGAYPNGVKFPQIYLRKGLNKTVVGGFHELEEFFRATYDHKELKSVAKHLTRNLNHVIDYNYYPTDKTKRSNLRHRPIGLGVQGLANVFLEMGYAFDSDEAKDLNQDIFETIYYGAMEASMELAKEREPNMIKLMTERTNCANSEANVGIRVIDQMGKKLNVIPEELNRDKYLGAYSTFEGSPLQLGKFQFDLWNKQPSDRYDWLTLMGQVQEYGVRNSLLVAPMPTASTAQILGNYECFEPIISNIYTRRVLAGEYMVLNNYLVQDLLLSEQWSKDMKNKIIANDGSIQTIEGIPQIFKDRYKTVWEMSQKDIIDMAVDRGKYICQSQSLNLFMAAPDTNKLTSMHFYAWSKGLKTGLYYLRTRPSSKALQFTVKPEECESCSA